jgi:hypothetical protein
MRIRDTLAADRNKYVQVTIFVRPDTSEPIGAAGPAGVA